MTSRVEQCIKICPQCVGEGSYADGLDEAACSTVCTRCDGAGVIVDLEKLLAIMLEDIEESAKAIYEYDDPWSSVWKWPNLLEDSGADTYRAIAKAGITAYQKLYTKPLDEPDESS